MTLSVIDLTQVEHLGWCVSCDRHPATTLVVDDSLCPIEGDPSVGAEFGVCGMCVEVVFPNAVTRVPEPRVPTHDGS